MLLAFLVRTGLESRNEIISDLSLAMFLAHVFIYLFNSRRQLYIRTDHFTKASSLSVHIALKVVVSFLFLSRSSVPFCSSCGVIATNVLFSHMPTVPALGVIPEAFSWSSYSSNFPLRKHAFFASRSSCMLQAFAVDVSRLRSFKTLTTSQAQCSHLILIASMQSLLQVQRVV